MNEENNEMEKKVWPTVKDADGFFFANETEESMGISSSVYKNGNEIKRVTLSDGKVAIVRTTHGRDNKEIMKRVGGDADDYQNAQISVATTLDGQPCAFEDIQDMKSKDINKLSVANVALNF